MRSGASSGASCLDFDRLLRPLFTKGCSIRWGAQLDQRVLRHLRRRVLQTKELASELSVERWNRFWLYGAISLFTAVIPAIGAAITQHPVGGFLAPIGVGAYAASRAKEAKEKTRTISQSYGIDGQPWRPVALEQEYKAMALWDHRTYALSGVKSPTWKLPTSTTAEQAQRFFEASK